MSRDLPHLYEFGPFHLDPAERLLLRNGERVALAPKVFETLVALVEHRGHLIEKDRLMELVWPDSFVEESNLTNNVSTLRKTLGEGQNGQAYIETVSKRGYRFTAPVTEIPISAAEVVLERHTLTRIETEETEEEVRGDSRISTFEAEKNTSTQPATMSLSKATGPSRVTLFIALTVAVAGMVFGIYWLSTRNAGKRSLAGTAFPEIDISRLTTNGKTTHAAISPNGAYVAHTTVDAEGDSLWVRHVDAPSSVRIAGPARSEYVSVKFAPDGGSIYLVTLDRDKGDTLLSRIPVLGGPASVVTNDGSPIDFSPDGSRIAFFRSYQGESRLLLANVDGSNERTLAIRKEPEFFRPEWNAPAWSPDGKTIACQARLRDDRGQYETVVGVNVADGAQAPLTLERWSDVGQPVWVADGSGLLVTASESATAPAQIWHIALSSGHATRVTHDLNDYSEVSITTDSSRFSAVQKHSVSSIWIAPAGDAVQAKQIATEVGWIREFAWTPEGRIVYRSNAGGSAEVWVMNADGSNPKQLTTGARASRGLSVSPDGRTIFFSAEREGRFNIWRVDADGSNLKQLTTGDDDYYPQSTPDGQWIVFQHDIREPRLWKVPVNGGEPQQLTETRANWPDVSPDGQMITYYYLDPDVEKSRWRIGIVSANGGRTLQRFDLPPTVSPLSRFVRWSPDRQSIAFANNQSGLSDIWRQPLDGSPPRQLTHFRAEQIIAFDWSPDDRSLAVIRGAQTSDVVLIRQQQK